MPDEETYEDAPIEPIEDIPDFDKMSDEEVY